MCYNFIAVEIYQRVHSWEMNQTHQCTSALATGAALLQWKNPTNCPASKKSPGEVHCRPPRLIILILILILILLRSMQESSKGLPYRRLKGLELPQKDTVGWLWCLAKLYIAPGQAWDFPKTSQNSENKFDMLEPLELPSKASSCYEVSFKHLSTDMLTHAHAWLMLILIQDI